MLPLNCLARQCRIGMMQFHDSAVKSISMSKFYSVKQIAQHYFKRECRVQKAFEKLKMVLHFTRQIPEMQQQGVSIWNNSHNSLLKARSSMAGSTAKLGCTHCMLSACFIVWD